MPALTRDAAARAWFALTALAAFTGVDDLGYARVVLNIAIVGVFFVALAAGAAALDRLLSRRATGGGRSARPRSARA